jgi:hypothetical protein
MKKDVLVVPKSAVDFFPPADVMKRYNKGLRKRGEPPYPEPGGEFSAGADQYRGSSDSSQTSALWYIDDGNELCMEMVETGSSDDNLVEVTRSDNLREGMLIITGIIDPGKKNEQNDKSSNQLMNIGSQPGTGGPPPPPGGP